jgi:hypothetical protein
MAHQCTPIIGDNNLTLQHSTRHISLAPNIPRDTYEYRQFVSNRGEQVVQQFFQQNVRLTCGPIQSSYLTLAAPKEQLPPGKVRL